MAIESGLDAVSRLIVSFLSGAYGNPPDFTQIPLWLIFAMDHAMFIGVMTNGLFGLVYENMLKILVGQADVKIDTPFFVKSQMA